MCVCVVMWCVTMGSWIEKKRGGATLMGHEWTADDVYYYSRRRVSSPLTSKQILSAEGLQSAAVAGNP